MIAKAVVIEDSAAVLLARVLKASGAPIVQADVSSISVKVFDAGEASQVGSTYTPTVSAVVYNTLQTDSRWSEDTTGYNLAIALAGSYWPTAGRYQAEVKITPVSGDAFYVVFALEALNIFSA